MTLGILESLLGLAVKIRDFFSGFPRLLGRYSHKDHDSRALMCGGSRV